MTPLSITPVILHTKQTLTIVIKRSRREFVENASSHPSHIGISTAGSAIYQQPIGWASLWGVSFHYSASNILTLQTRDFLQQELMKETTACCSWWERNPLLALTSLLCRELMPGDSTGTKSWDVPGIGCSSCSSIERLLALSIRLTCGCPGCCSAWSLLPSSCRLLSAATSPGWRMSIHCCTLLLTAGAATELPRHRLLHLRHTSSGERFPHYHNFYTTAVKLQSCSISDSIMEAKCRFLTYYYFFYLICTVITRPPNETWNRWLK